MLTSMSPTLRLYWPAYEASKAHIVLWLDASSIYIVGRQEIGGLYHKLPTREFLSYVESVVIRLTGGFND